MRVVALEKGGTTAQDDKTDMLSMDCSTCSGGVRNLALFRLLPQKIERRCNASALIMKCRPRCASDAESFVGVVLPQHQALF